MYIRYVERGSDDRALTWADYRDLGGVIGALRRRADQEYTRLKDRDRETMQLIMLRMVSLEHGNIARRRVPKAELEYPEDAQNRRVDAVIRRLTDQRLLVEGSESLGESYVEPAHDALVAAWGLLLGWIRETEADPLGNLHFQRRLGTDAAEWDRAREAKVNRGLLWRGARVDVLDELTRKKKRAAWLNRRELAFARKSLGRRRLVRWMAAGASLAGLGAALIVGGLNAASGIDDSFPELVGYDLSNSDLGGVGRSPAEDSGVVASEIEWDRRLELSYGDLFGANLSMADLTGVLFFDADLSEANLRGTILNDAELNDVDLTGADLTGATLINADLSTGDDIAWFLFNDREHSVLTGATLVNADLTRADLRGADLSDADLTGARLIDADLSAGSAMIWLFERPRRKHTVLTNATLIDADLTGADLSGADLFGVDLTGADLTGATLTDAILTAIRYDETTSWPEGFSPPPRSNLR